MTVRDAFVPATTAAALKLLSQAISDREVPSDHKVAAQADSRAPQDGLALLAAYTAIEDRQLRQAILDVVVAVSTSADR